MGVTQDRFTAPDLDDDTVAQLARYATGSASAEEAAQVERWMAGNPDRRSLVDRIVATWRLIGERPDPLRLADFDLERAQLDLKRKIRWTPPRRSRWVPGAAAAAAAVIVGLGGAGWWAKRMLAPSDASQLEWIAEHRTGDRELRTVVLSDGSRVTLAPGSRLRQARFGTTRTVDLSGKAYFEVTHDPARPFLAHAGAVETRVLGTTFSVTARAGDATDVVLQSGRVAVTAWAPDKLTRALLQPGQRAVTTPDGSLDLAEADVGVELAWTTGRLAFAGTPVERVTRELGHWLGTPVIVADSSLLRRRVTGSFTLDSAFTIVRAIAALVDARIVQRGDTVLFERRLSP